MKKLINLCGYAAIDPWFITGFTDAEGCFLLSIVKDKKYKNGWSVKFSFQMGLHKKD
jgi:hypothetical protein